VERLSSVAIRRANSNDLLELANIESASKSAVSNLWSVNNRNRYIGGDTFTYLSEDERPFGFVTSGSPLEEYFRDELTGEILGVYLHPEYQGFGYGKKLLVHGLTVLKRRGFETAIMWIPEVAKKAIALSEYLKFEKVDGAHLHDNEVGGLDHYCYKLDLAGYF